MKKTFITISLLLIATVAFAASYASYQSPLVTQRSIDQLADNETLLAATSTSDNDTFTSGVIWMGRCSGKIGLWIDVDKRGAVEPSVRVEVTPGISQTTYATDNVPTPLVNIRSSRIEYVEIEAPLAEYITVSAINDGPGVAKITIYSFIK